MYVPNEAGGGGQQIPQQNNQQQIQQNNKYEEEKDGSDMQIDSSAKDPSFQQLLLQKNNSTVQGEMNLEAFMSIEEKQRAQTIYQQMQQMREESLCKYCDNLITD